MRPSTMESFVPVGAGGKFETASAPSIEALFTPSQLAAAASGSPIATHTPGTVGSYDVSIPGVLGAEPYDLYGVTLTAGVTYTFAQRGTAAGGIEDPFMAIFSSSFALLAQDDDGGFGRSAMITFTPTTTGTYYIFASSWYHVDPSAPGYPTADQGNYTVDIWRANPANDVGATFALAPEIDLGTTYGHLEAAGDKDMYKIVIDEADVGQFFSFTYAGGISGGGDWDGEPGENIGIVRIYNADGQQIAAAVNYETGVGFLAEQAGTYYIRVEGYEAAMTGGYTLDVSKIDPATQDPLDAIRWQDAGNIPTVDVGGVPTAYVYFAPAGENFGELADDGETPMETYGWEQHQIDAVMHALNTQYTPITGINYVITTDPDQATFRMLTTISEQYGAYAYPQDPAYGEQAGILVFNLASGGFGNYPASLEPGGFSYAVILHEFGHAHGLAHPHDNGGGSDVMLGVAGSSSLGIYDLNQGVYTVMSYNDGWQTHPDGTLNFSRQTLDNGWSETLSAFDIAALQERYGTHDANTGNTVYDLTQHQKIASYSTIWDTGGIDTITYKGGQNAHIDLLAATLDYTPTGGGVVSFISGTFGGYTIANGVVIENASGGSGHDTLLGNSANNTLTGNNGNDFLLGREGDDILLGGNGTDTLNGGLGNDTLNGGAGIDTYAFDSAGSDTVVGYQKSEKFDLSELDVNWSDVKIESNKIIIDVDGNDSFGGAGDLVINLNTKGITQSDFIFG